MKALFRLTPARAMALAVRDEPCDQGRVSVRPKPWPALGLLIAPNPLVARLVYWLTHYEIADQPGDTMAAWTQRAVEQFPVSTQHFYGWYLMFHGGLKLTMVIMLWARVLWAYPAAMVVLAGFVIYQLA